MTHCLICGKEAEHVADYDWGGLVKCQLCGEYKYTDSAMPKLKHQTNDPDVAAKVGAFIKEKNLRDIVPTFFTHSGDYPREVTLEEALEAYPQALSDRVSRTLANLSLLQGDFDGIAELQYSEDHSYCFAKDWMSAVRFVQGLKEEELVVDRGSHQRGLRISLTMKGWNRAEQEFKGREKQQSKREEPLPASTAECDSMSYEYDVVLSFAGEQRDYVEDVADILRRQALQVFYDLYEDVELWGKDLVEHLHEVYARKGRYCVMFISHEYAEKVWPTAERRAALERQVAQKGEYILPARFDDTELPGLPTTVGYIDLSGLPPADFAKKITRKVTGHGLLAELEKTVTLQEPFEPVYEGASEDRISLQYAVREIARQVGLEYSVREAQAKLGEIARKWIEPEFADVPAGEAFRRVLEPYGIRWTLRDRKLELELPADYEWLEVRRWEGKGPKTTEAFTAEGEWRVRWEKKAERGWNFKIYLYRPGEEAPLEALVDENVREASGETYVHRPGRFYLDVKPRQPQEYWQLVVEQRTRLATGA